MPKGMVVLINLLLTTLSLLIIGFFNDKDIYLGAYFWSLSCILFQSFWSREKKRSWSSGHQLCQLCQRGLRWSNHIQYKGRKPCISNAYFRQMIRWGGNLVGEFLNDQLILVNFCCHLSRSNQCGEVIAVLNYFFKNVFAKILILNSLILSLKNTISRMTCEELVLELWYNVAT